MESKSEIVVENRLMHNYSVFDNGLPFSTNLWEKPDSFYGEDLNSNTKRVFIRSDYNNTESYAFAYLGIPNKSGKLPAVLLIHGGGGTAYIEWVNLWVDRGYIALAIDLEGHIPNVNATLSDVGSDLYTSSNYNTPHNQNYNDASKPIEEQWMYYATTTSIIANSFLHSLEQVDIYNIGVCGISWGGVITSIIAGYDDRFAFAIPMYCSIGMLDSGSTLDSYMQNNPLAKIYDATEAIKQIQTPINLIVSNVDANYYISSASTLITSLKNGTLSILPNWLHSHGHAVDIFEAYSFADQVVNHEETLKFIDYNTLEVNDYNKVAEVYIYYTYENLSGTTSWSKKKTNVIDNKVINTVPEGAKTYFVNLLSTTGFTSSSKVFSGIL